MQSIEVKILQPITGPSPRYPGGCQAVACQPRLLLPNASVVLDPIMTVSTVINFPRNIPSVAFHLQEVDSCNNGSLSLWFCQKVLEIKLKNVFWQIMLRDMWVIHHQHVCMFLHCISGKINRINIPPQSQTRTPGLKIFSGKSGCWRENFGLGYMGCISQVSCIPIQIK